MSVSVLLASDERAAAASKTTTHGEDVIPTEDAVTTLLPGIDTRSTPSTLQQMPFEQLERLQDAPRDVDLDPFADPFRTDYGAGDVPSIITDIPTSAASTSMPPSPTTEIGSVEPIDYNPYRSSNSDQRDEQSYSGFDGPGAAHRSNTPRRSIASETNIAELVDQDPEFVANRYLSSDVPADVESESDSLESPVAKKRRTVYGVVGISASAQASQKLKAAMRDDTLVKNKKRLDTYQQACRVFDRDAQFEYGAKWRVWHSVCGKWYSQKEAYSTTRFTAHAEECTQRRVDLALAKRKESGENVNRGDVKVARLGSLDKWVKRTKKNVVKVVEETGTP